jgi:hypothetical protein
MNPELPAPDVALVDVCRLLEAASVAFRLVGGIAVVHHGYARTTEDVDVLVQANARERIKPLLSEHGFERLSPCRLRHVATGVRVDLLFAGEPMPGANRPSYPSPTEVGASPRDARVIDLPGLMMLKLRAGRHRDQADVVELLKRIDEAHYLELEASIDRSMRPDLAALRRDAIEELESSG